MIRPNDEDLDDGRYPVVPFVPFTCPSCGRHKPFTSNVRGRMRQHKCQACGQIYRSRQFGPDSVNWDEPPPGRAVPPAP